MDYKENYYYKVNKIDYLYSEESEDEIVNPEEWYAQRLTTE